MQQKQRNLCGLSNTVTERTVLSRTEETGNVHAEKDQCEDMMTIRLGVRDCEDVDYGVQNHVK